MKGEIGLPPLKDLTGKRFERWTVIRRADDYISPKGAKKIRYHCRCDCGNESDVQAIALTTGKSKSCGCLQLEWAYEAGRRSKKHGMKHTRLYRVWSNMHTRCYCQTNTRYGRYGGRGIKMCDEWVGSDGFQNFYNWAMENGYREDLTIDRIDNDGNYFPENCRWTDNKTQSNNRRTNRRVSVDGVDKTIAEWSDQLNLSSAMLYKKSDEIVSQIIRYHIGK